MKIAIMLIIVGAMVGAIGLWLAGTQEYSPVLNLLLWTLAVVAGVVIGLSGVSRAASKIKQ